MHRDDLCIARDFRREVLHEPRMTRGARWILMRTGALAIALGLAQAMAGSAHAQGFGSAAVANVGPPELALFPSAAALQDRLEEQGWMLRGQGTFVLQGNGKF